MGYRMVTQYGKLTLGHVGFKYPRTRQSEGLAGIIVAVIPGQKHDEPHLKLELPDGTTHIFDYSMVGDADKRTPCETVAIVKQLFPIGVKLQGDSRATIHVHREWRVKEVTSDGWALAQDPWAGRWHWLPSRTAGGDHVYSFIVGPHGQSYEVTMEALVR